MPVGVIAPLTHLCRCSDKMLEGHVWINFKRPILQSSLNNKNILERRCKDLLQNVNFATPLGVAITCQEGHERIHLKMSILQII